MAENNNVVAKLCSDGSVWPVDHGNATLGELVNLVNYKIRTEGDMVNKHNKLSTTNVPTAVVDLGKQLLLYAKDSDLTGVQTMLSRGAPFTSDWLGMSALHFAAMNNQYEICDVLIKGGMNKDIKTKVDRTPLHFATYYGHERIVEMLLSRKCAVNPKDMLRMTPLHWAIERRHKNVVRLLLKYNADVNVVTKFNKTPIGIAVQTEQADILAELQTAKAEQAKKKFNEEQEKEISSAVGTILAIAVEQSETSTDFMEVDDNESSSNSTKQSANSNNFKTTQETGIMDKTAINLLKSHGISMLQEEDEDASKDLLSTALQNGRQLVLSEGGKMLLNETRQHRSIRNNLTAANAAVQHKTSIISNSNDKQNNNNNNKQKQQQNINNVRIVSYKEFQNMFYNNSDGKPIEKPTPTMSNMRIIRQQNDAAINLSSTASAKNSTTSVGGRNSFVNTNTTRASQQVPQQQHRQLKITPMKTANLTTSTIATTTSTIPTTTCTTNNNQTHKDCNDLSDIIQLIPSDNEIDADVNEIEQQQQQRIGTPVNNNTASAGITNSSNTGGGNAAVCFTTGTTRRIEAATKIGTASTVRQVNVIKRPHPQSQQSQLSHMKIAANSNLKPSSVTNAKPTPNVMPLLSTPEICRQLHEMRKQNDELRRRVDTLQKEKDEMRQRLDHLEELMLVERADDETFEIES